MSYFNYIGMTEEEKKIFWIGMGILLVILIIYGIYYYFFKKEK